MRRFFFLLNSLTLILFSISGCGTSALDVRNRPVTPVLTRPTAPSPTYIWIDGNWIRQGNRFIFYKSYRVAPRPYRQYYPQAMGNIKDMEGFGLMAISEPQQLIPDYKQERI